MMSLKNTSDRLNKELDLYHNIDPIQYLNEMDKINKQTACFVCGKEFDEKTRCHLHHDHKQEKNNIIGIACARCNLSMTEKRRAGISQWFTL